MKFLARQARKKIKSEALLIGDFFLKFYLKNKIKTTNFCKIFQ